MLPFYVRHFWATYHKTGNYGRISVDAPLQCNSKVICELIFAETTWPCGLHAHAWSDDYYFANNIFIVCFADKKFSLYICGWTHAAKILSTEYTEIKLSFYLRI